MATTLQTNPLCGAPPARHSIRGLLSVLCGILLCAGCQNHHAARSPVLDLDNKQWTAPDGRSFPLEIWSKATDEPPQAPTARLWIAIHGLGGAATDFEAAARFLTKHGSVVIAPNLRAMGNDPETSRRGHLRKSEDWQADLVCFIKLVQEAYPEHSIFLHGESLGGLIAVHLSANPAIKGSIDGMVLCAPVLFFDAPMPAWQQTLVRLVNLVAPRLKVDLKDVQEGDSRELPPVSRDPQVLADLQNAPHFMTRFSVGFLFRIHRMMQQVPHALQNSRVPTLVMYGEQDLFIDAEQMKQFMHDWQRKNPALVFKAFPDAHHLLLRDLDAPKVEEAWLNWLSQH